MCDHCAQTSYTLQHKEAQIIFHLIFKQCLQLDTFYYLLEEKRAHNNKNVSKLPVKQAGSGQHRAETQRQEQSLTMSPVTQAY